MISFKAAAAPPLASKKRESPSVRNPSEVSVFLENMPGGLLGALGHTPPLLDAGSLRMHG